MIVPESGCDDAAEIERAALKLTRDSAGFDVRPSIRKRCAINNRGSDVDLRVQSNFPQRRAVRHAPACAAAIAIDISRFIRDRVLCIGNCKSKRAALCLLSLTPDSITGTRLRRLSMKTARARAYIAFLRARTRF